MAELDPQKAALLSAIAQQGTQGKIAFDAEAQRRQQAQQAAQGAILARSNGMTGSAGGAPAALTNELQAKQAALGSIYAQDAAMSNQGFQNSLAQTAASNAAYMDQASAALPLLRQQTAGTVAQIRAEQEQQRLDREQADKDRQAADEQRQWAREDRLYGQQEIQNADKEADVEKWNTAIAERQDGVIRDVNRELPESLASLISNAVDVSENVPEAIDYVNRKLSENYQAQQAGEEGPIPGYDRTSRQEIARRIYQFFTLNKPPQDPDELDQALQAEGISLSDVDPRYTPKKKKGTSKSKASSAAPAAGRSADPGTKWKEAPSAVRAKYLEDFQTYAGKHPGVDDSILVNNYRAARRRLGKWYPTDNAR